MISFFMGFFSDQYKPKEANSSPSQDKAAIKIQSIYRGYAIRSLLPPKSLQDEYRPVYQQLKQEIHEVKSCKREVYSLPKSSNGSIPVFFPSDKEWILKFPKDLEETTKRLRKEKQIRNLLASQGATHLIVPALS